MPPAPHIPQIRRFQDWLAAHRNLRFADYQALWQWSVDDLPAFWQAVWDFYGRAVANAAHPRAG